MPSGFTKIESIGHVTTTDRGTQVASDATANTKGAWAQLEASTPNDYVGFFGSIGTGGDGAAGGERRLVDIAMGAVSSEIILVPDLFHNFHGIGDWNTPVMMPIFWVPIPKGSRVSARSQQDLTSNLTFDLMLYGIVGGAI